MLKRIEALADVLFWGGLSIMLFGMIGELLWWRTQIGVVLMSGGGFAGVLGMLVVVRARLEARYRELLGDLLPPANER